MTMTQKEFFWWLKGYLHGETYLSNINIEEIKEQMNKVEDQQSTTSLAWVSNPSLTGTIIVPSNASTTQTSSQLLND